REHLRAAELLLEEDLLRHRRLHAGSARCRAQGGRRDERPVRFGLSAQHRRHEGLPRARRHAAGRDARRGARRQRRSHLRPMTIRLLIAAVLLYSGSAMAQVKVIISGGFSTAYRQLLPEFEKSTGIAVTTGSGASQGKGPTTIASQLERGERFDVVIMSREGLSELMAAGRI